MLEITLEILIQLEIIIAIVLEVEIITLQVQEVVSISFIPQFEGFYLISKNSYDIIII